MKKLSTGLQIYYQNFTLRCTVLDEPVFIKSISMKIGWNTDQNTRSKWQSYLGVELADICYYFI